MALPLLRGLSLVLVRIIFPGDTPLLPSMFQPCFIPANRVGSLLNEEQAARHNRCSLPGIASVGRVSLHRGVGNGHLRPTYVSRPRLAKPSLHFAS